MNVSSTRGGSTVSLSEAIAAGLAPDGGLYMPPLLAAHVGEWGHDYRTRALTLLRPFFEGELLDAQLEAILSEAFTFDAPTKWLDERTGLLELFHGPTAAFKDFGARFLAACLSRLRTKETTVLVATSGDTGAAVASAFHRRPGFRVVILFPHGRVAPRQAHQLGAFGDNVTAFRVQGAFDDCQRMVKEAFADRALTEKHQLTSANSISLGRLLPQMTYYAHASLSAAEQGSVSFIIPTGNLGNAFACLLARERGLPIEDIVLATNANRVLADYVTSGVYEPKPSLTTLANAIVRSSPQPDSRPWHSAPPKASPAPRPFTTSTWCTPTSTVSSRVLASTPRGPCLTTASSTPRSSSASAARCGSLSPTATRHSSRLPIATVTCSSTGANRAVASLDSSQNIGR